MKELVDTVDLMCSEDYGERLVAEYWQLKIRYEKLKNFCNKIEGITQYNFELSMADYPFKKREVPKHDCPLDLLRQQQRQMGELLHTLEIRAVIEKINLEGEEK